MRVRAAVLLFAMTALPGWAQQGTLNQTAEPLPPAKVPCRYQRFSGTQQVKGTPSIEELIHFDLSALTVHQVSFAEGTIVSVNRQDGAWSCVSGGSPFRTGWMKASLLEPTESGTGHPCSAQQTSSQLCATASIPR